MSKFGFTLTAGLALFVADTSSAQYPGRPTQVQLYQPSVQRTQLPLWNANPPVAPQPQLPAQHQVPQVVDSAPTPTTQFPTVSRQQAYRPSEMRSVNPFGNVGQRQQQAPAAYGQPPSLSQTQSYFQTQQTSAGYNTQPVTYGSSQFASVGGGVGQAAPIQQINPVPSQNSFYDQPIQSYTPQFGYGPEVAVGGCDVVVAPQGRSGWYARAGAVIMNRDRENNLWLSYDQTDIRDRTLSSNDAEFSYAGGVSGTIGHYFNCGRNSLEMSYWGIYPGTAEANSLGAATAAGIDTILHFDGLQYDAGAGALDLAGNFFFGADRHRVQRNYEVHNLELNFLGYNFANCGPMQLGWTAGVRYFRFNDDFLYSSDPIDTVFTGAPDEVHYGIDVENNLVGVQIGGRADYCLSNRTGLFFDTKIGIYGNHISHRSRIYGANGQAFVGDATSPYFGEDFDIQTNRDDFAMIGELVLGAKWCLNSCWTLNAGYRAVSVSGVALSTNQVPVDFIAALDSVRQVDANGSLILHGAFIGLDYCY